jgi:hypothetical protein
MSCASCGDSENRCGNPCGASDTNTPACETLPSQIENFSLQFFGTVVKTEVDGKVVWSLPCNLDVGLPNNPRSVDEGLACYFLRLFHDGITGLTGPKGDAGDNGTNGNNAFTVSLKSFSQPSIASPIVQVVTQYNPAIIAGIYVNISGSGWYLVNETDGNGVLLLTLVKSADGASGTITAGKLVVPSGFPGVGLQGIQGLQGPKGDTGPAGQDFTASNGFYYATVGTDFPLPLTYTAVDYVNSAPTILLPSAGLYLVTATVGLIGNTGVATSDAASLKLFNSTISGDVPGSEQEISGLADGQLSQLSINVRIQTDSANQTIALLGKCTTATKVSTRSLHTTLTYVRLV